MNLYHIKLTDNQKDALESLFNMGIVWNKTEQSEAWEQLREQVREASCTVAIINALQDSGCNCKKPTEPAPKYDPCRKFKAGDKVSPRFWHDRPPVASAYCGDSAFMPKDGVYEVKEDERNSQVLIDYHGKLVFVSACHLELITPVEARVSFRVGDFPVDGEWSVWKDSFEKTEIISSYKIATHPNAKAAAEAERDRLIKQENEKESDQ